MAGIAMENRHLFRGKRLGNGEWVTGQPLYCGKTLFIVGDLVEACEEYCSPEFWYSVDPSTIGQCTGIYAAKSYRGESEADRLVYQGDVVKRTQHHSKLGDCSCEYVVEWDNKKLGYGILYLIAEYETLEIIGNIHDLRREVSEKC